MDKEDPFETWINRLQVFAGVVVGLVIIVNEAFGAKNLEVMAFGAFIAGLGVPLVLDRRKKKQASAQEDDTK